MKLTSLVIESCKEGKSNQNSPFRKACFPLNSTEQQLLNLTEEKNSVKYREADFFPVRFLVTSDKRYFSCNDLENKLLIVTIRV